MTTTTMTNDLRARRDRAAAEVDRLANLVDSYPSGPRCAALDAAARLVNRLDRLLADST
jgi:hypothetical protein